MTTAALRFVVMTDAERGKSQRITVPVRPVDVEAVRGWVTGAWPRKQLLSFTPAAGDPSPPTAVVDWYEPPHPASFDEPGLCDSFLRSVVGREIDVLPDRVNGSYYLLRPDAHMMQALAQRLHIAKSTWWAGLDISHWILSLKRYAAGQRHLEHMDWYPASGDCRKLSASINLSDPSSYEGGGIVVSWYGHELRVPRTRGTFVAWPGWIHHRVEPITAGERWSLVVHGMGPALR